MIVYGGKDAADATVQDSFLFDFNIGDDLEYLQTIKSILEQNGKFPVKVSWGNNYHEMQDITEKFAV